MDGCVQRVLQKCVPYIEGGGEHRTCFLDKRALPAHEQTAQRCSVLLAERTGCWDDMFPAWWWWWVFSPADNLLQSFHTTSPPVIYQFFHGTHS